MSTEENNICKIAAACQGESDQKLMEVHKNDTRENVNEGNEDDNGRTRLMYACEFGRLLYLVALLNLGASMAIHDKGGWTAMMWAACKGQEECVKELIKRGCSVDESNIHGVTALMLASRFAHDGCAQALIDAKCSMNARDQEGTTSLMYACMTGYDRCVKLLIDAGCLVNEKDEEGCTALMIACENEHDRCVKCLIEAGCLVNEKNDKGLTPLMYACRAGKLMIVNCLLNKKVDVLAADASGRSALVYAAAAAHLDIVLSLYKTDPRVCQIDDKKVVDALCMYLDTESIGEAIQTDFCANCFYKHTAEVDKYLTNIQDAGKELNFRDEGLGGALYYALNLNQEHPDGDFKKARIIAIMILSSKKFKLQDAFHNDTKETDVGKAIRESGHYEFVRWIIKIMHRYYGIIDRIPAMRSETNESASEEMWEQLQDELEAVSFGKGTLGSDSDRSSWEMHYQNEASPLMSEGQPTEDLRNQHEGQLSKITKDSQHEVSHVMPESHPIEGEDQERNNLDEDQLSEFRTKDSQHEGSPLMSECQSTEGEIPKAGNQDKEQLSEIGMSDSQHEFPLMMPEGQSTEGESQQLNHQNENQQFEIKVRDSENEASPLMSEGQSAKGKSPKLSNQHEVHSFEIITTDGQPEAFPLMSKSRSTGEESPEVSNQVENQPSEIRTKKGSPLMSDQLTGGESLEASNEAEDQLSKNRASDRQHEASPLMSEGQSTKDEIPKEGNQDEDQLPEICTSDNQHEVSLMMAEVQSTECERAEVKNQNENQQFEIKVRNSEHEASSLMSKDQSTKGKSPTASNQDEVHPFEIIRTNDQPETFPLMPKSQPNGRESPEVSNLDEDQTPEISQRQSQVVIDADGEAESLDVIEDGLEVSDKGKARKKILARVIIEEELQFHPDGSKEERMEAIATCTTRYLGRSNFTSKTLEEVDRTLTKELNIKTECCTGYRHIQMVGHMCRPLKSCSKSLKWSLSRVLDYFESLTCVSFIKDLVKNHAWIILIFTMFLMPTVPYYVDLITDIMSVTETMQVKDVPVFLVVVSWLFALGPHIVISSWVAYNFQNIFFLGTHPKVQTHIVVHQSLLRGFHVPNLGWVCSCVLISTLQLWPLVSFVCLLRMIFIYRNLSSTTGAKKLYKLEMEKIQSKLNVVSEVNASIEASAQLLVHLYVLLAFSGQASWLTVFKVISTPIFASLPLLGNERKLEYPARLGVEGSLLLLITFITRYIARFTLVLLSLIELGYYGLLPFLFTIFLVLAICLLESHQKENKMDITQVIINRKLYSSFLHYTPHKTSSSNTRLHLRLFYPVGVALIDCVTLTVIASLGFSNSLFWYSVPIIVVCHSVSFLCYILYFIKLHPWKWLLKY